MYCPTCGNDQFLCIDENIDDLLNASDDVTLKCSDCGSIFTKRELIEGNQDIISANIEDIKQEAIKDLENKLKKMFK